MMEGIEAILSDLRKKEGVKGTLVASTSGGYIAGEPPASAHLETFTTMSAILLGAAQTATKELKDKLRYVEIKLVASRLIIMPAGEGALLVIEAEDTSDLDSILEKGTEASIKISEAI